MTESLSMEQLTYIESRLANERKSAGVAYALWFFVGAFGGHNFYLGRTVPAVLQLGLSIVGWATLWFMIGWFFLAALGVWLIIDAFLIPGVIRSDIDLKRATMVSALGTDASEKPRIPDAAPAGPATKST